MHNWLILRYRLALAGQEGILDRARFNLLTVLLILFAFQRVVSLWLLMGEAEFFYIWRSTLVLFLLIAALTAQLAGVSWKFIGHIYLWIVIFLTWSAMLTLRQGVNLVTLQYILILISVAYFILGTRWGLFYSVLNIMAITSLVFLPHYTGIDLMQTSRSLNVKAFNFLFVYNFFTLLFVHYYFFDAFAKSSRRERILALDLGRSLKDAQDIASAKTNFLSTMSHELRTPLNAVVGIADVLLGSDLKPEQKQNLEILSFSAENLMFIINDILDFNMIDAEKVVLRTEPFQLDVLLENIYSSFIGEARAKNVDFVFKCGPGLDGVILLGDKYRLSQILFNLVGNAVKFTPRGRVAVETVICKQDKGEITFLFTIQDTGIGISPEDLNQILDPYVRRNTKSNRQFYGTGLGLTIADRLIMLMGGTLSISSSEGAGTRLGFELAFGYIRKNDSELRVQRARAVKDISALRVLVAEDNAINVVVIKKLLCNWNISPVVASNGKEAVDAVRSSDFDVVLMDINMPVIDGLEASKMIRSMADKTKASVPIIALTASVDFNFHEHLENKNIDDYLLKPFTPDLLKEKLDKVSV